MLLGLILATQLMAAGVVTEVSQTQMRSILRQMRLPFSETAHGAQGAFRFEMDGRPVALNNYATSLLLLAGLADTTGAERMNAWNQNFQSGRAYTDAQGHPYLEADLAVGGGVTEKTIEEFIRRFGETLGLFARFVADPRPAPLTPGAASRPGLLLFNAGKMSVVYDSAKWKPAPLSEAGRFTFQHVSGEGYAEIAVEDMRLPLEALPERVLARLREQAPQAAIASREKRTVNGSEVWRLRIDAEIKASATSYLGYYYSGKEGTVQIVTYTGRNLFQKYEADFTDFLESFRVAR
jgi:hypothetical protein